MSGMKGLDVDPKILAEDLPQEELPETIVCLGCKSARKHDEFKHRPADVRCVYCVETSKARGEDLDRAALTRKMMANLFDSSGLPVASTMPRPSEVAGGLIEEMGGLHNFVHQWADHVTTLGANRPGSVAAVKAYNEIGKFILQASRQEDQRDIAEMTTDELIAQRTNSVKEALREVSMEDHRYAIAAMLIESTGADPAEIIGAIPKPSKEEAPSSE